MSAGIVKGRSHILPVCLGVSNDVKGREHFYQEGMKEKNKWNEACDKRKEKR